LDNKKASEDWEANRPPDERWIFDIPRPYPREVTEVRRHREGDRIIEWVLPATKPGEECIGCCMVKSPNMSVDETLRLLRDRRLREKEALAARQRSDPSI
jgi:hypothetical protein